MNTLLNNSTHSLVILQPGAAPATSWLDSKEIWQNWHAPEKKCQTDEAKAPALGPIAALSMGLVLLGL